MLAPQRRALSSIFLFACCAAAVFRGARGFVTTDTRPVVRGDGCPLSRLTAGALGGAQRRHGGRQRTEAPRMAFRITILMCGRSTGGDRWIADAFDDYARRMKGTIDLHTEWHRTNDALESAAMRARRSQVCGVRGPAH
jgi:hypothetical protein